MAKFLQIPGCNGFRLYPTGEAQTRETQPKEIPDRKLGEGRAELEAHPTPMETVTSLIRLGIHIKPLVSSP